MKLTIAAFALLQAFQASAQAYYPQPAPIPCKGSACVNPNGELPFQDMSVIRRGDGTYYRYSKGTNIGDGMNVATSLSLQGPWTEYFTVLGPTDQLKSPCGAADGHKTSWRWAPEVHYYNGLYYLFYTVEHPDGGNTCFDQCVATSPSMEGGSWTDHGSMNIPSPGLEKASDGSSRVPYVRLDGNLLATSDDPQGLQNPKYMVFGSYQFGLYGVPLTDDLLTAVPGAQPKLIIADQYQPPAKDIPADGDRSGNYTEGAYQLQHGNYIYLFYSRGDCCAPGSDDVISVYQTEVCRTTVAEGPTGRYIDRDGLDCTTGGSQGYYRQGSIFLESNSKSSSLLQYVHILMAADQNGNQATVFAPGSVGVINDPTEGLCMWYQYQDNTSNMPNLRFGYNYLSFDKDDWPILTATRT